MSSSFAIDKKDERNNDIEKKKQLKNLLEILDNLINEKK